MGNIMHDSGSSSLFIVILCILLHLAISTLEPELDDNIVKAEVQSCSGCSLNRLPDVKAFIFEDLPKYQDVSFKHISGAQPEMVFYNAALQEIERVPLKDFSRIQCRHLLNEKGFSLTDQASLKNEL